MTLMALDRLYAEKPATYYEMARREIIDVVPIGNHSVLEVGCGTGNTGSALKVMGRASEVVGIELNERSAEVARRQLDTVLVGNVEELVLPFENERFDFIIFGDVIEHLIDPWTQLRRLSALLKADGKMVATIPNVRNWKVVGPLLLFGRWRYQDWGLLDKGHLRFFTKEGMSDLFEQAGLAVVRLSPLLGFSSKSGKVNALTFGVLEGLLAPHYLVIGSKASGHP